MDLAGAKTFMSSLKLPAWVLGWRVEEMVDLIGEPYIRVWLEVDEGLDIELLDRDITELETVINSGLRKQGLAPWSMVSLDSGVYED